MLKLRINLWVSIKKKNRKEARGAQILAKHYFQPQVPN